MKCEECGHEDVVCYDPIKVGAARNVVLTIMQELLGGLDGFDPDDPWLKGKSMEVAHKAVRAFLGCPPIRPRP